ncbi:MAG: transcriptional regulator, MarR family [Firmicutes bacterium]|nr:transcriptional regulator, MarR family [Bacillota bacterium]
MERKPEKYIGYWINKVERTMKNIHDKRFQEYGITLSQGSLLHQLWHKDGLTQTEMQERLKLRGASVSGLVDALIKKGLIVRKQDNEDARYKRLYLTEKGRTIEDKTIGLLMELDEEIMEGFDQEEKDMLICWMRKLYSNLEKLDK